MPATEYTEKKISRAGTGQRQKLTPLMALRLAAPHTWPPASITPAILGALLALDFTGRSPILLTAALILIAVLMQSAANTFNDYYDFIKGLDTRENSDEPEDAVLVYNRINPAAARGLALGFLAAAALPGLYVVLLSGPAPLIAGLAGAAVLVLYSASPLPISFLPLGELVSGFTMGGLIPFGAYAGLTGRSDPAVILFSIPCIIGVGLVMMTNNLCDIERDAPAGRKTLPVLLGRERARKLYLLLFLLMVFSVLLIGIIRFGFTVLGTLPPLIAGLPLFKRLFRLTYVHSQRALCFKTVILSDLAVYGAYFIMILMHIFIQLSGKEEWVWLL
ncbi:MAG: prenyltransferase [Spirochaetaceae bacterium]|jgi:1,4-dihydroxy-2-naphthoate octaprenyltransferase|nr:prenyltransferase [Spirochaetaceae bacterium]